MHLYENQTGPVLEKAIILLSQGSSFGKEVECEVYTGSTYLSTTTLLKI